MNVETGGPAYPCGLQSGHFQPLYEGMTLRDYFAAKAMQPPVFSPLETEDETYERTAREAYKMADAMLKARHATRE